MPADPEVKKAETGPPDDGRPARRTYAPPRVEVTPLVDLVRGSSGTKLDTFNTRTNPSRR